ncbi:hypothetical protein JOF47_003674 [Paeniglutamicibacter kerguelensis]|uniref:Uncharacterized protein n=1 Tax=Paeniglutamicibacter kerguelensis TaxID=254788 RepID=A0ABS4XIS5_9MICC|nr:hypothetical protein [Paeniglutamicibacter kerguelensis]
MVLKVAKSPGRASNGLEGAMTNAAGCAFRQPPQAWLLRRRFVAVPDPMRTDTGLPQCSLAQAAILRRVTGNGRPVFALGASCCPRHGAPWTHHACHRFFRGPELAAPCGERGGFHPEDNLRRVSARKCEHLHPGQVEDCNAPIAPKPFPNTHLSRPEEDAECVPGRSYQSGCALPCETVHCLVFYDHFSTGNHSECP